MLWGVFICLVPAAVAVVPAPHVAWLFEADFSATVGGADFDGVASGGVSISGERARFGGASARFVRGEGGALHIPHSPFGGGDHTYAAWYYADLAEITGASRYFLLDASDGVSQPAAAALLRLANAPHGGVFSDEEGRPAGAPAPRTFFPVGALREWQHLAVTYEVASSTHTVYLNGSVVGTFIFADPSAALRPSDFLMLGADRSGANTWEGWIDAVAVWQEVLTPAAILHLQDNPPPVPVLEDRGPFVVWSFDEDFGASVGEDVFDATPVGAVTLSSERSRFGGGSARFERSGAGRLLVSASPFGGGSATVAAWYYLDLPAIAGANRYFVFEGSDGSSFPYSYGLRLLSGEGEVGQVYAQDDSGGSAHNDAFPAGAHGAWRHVAMVYDHDVGHVATYLNGKLVSAMFLNDGATGLAAVDYFVIGGHRSGIGRNWQGWIDEVAVWRRALDPREIALLQELPPAQLGRTGWDGLEGWLRERGQTTRSATGRLLPEVASGRPGLVEFAFSDLANEGGRSVRPFLEGDERLLQIPQTDRSTGLELTLEHSTDLAGWQAVAFEIIEADGDWMIVRPSLIPVSEP